jgi:hypothetical protein
MTHAPRHRFPLALSTGLVALLLVACGVTDDDSSAGGEPSPTAAATPTEEATTTPPPTVSQANLPPPVALAIEAAANDAGLPEAEIGLIGYEETSWNDTALGCPQPGGMYAQVITPGYNVRLLIDGREREYHTDMDTTVVRC